MLSSNADLAFTNSAEKMLKEKELKSQKKNKLIKLKQTGPMPKRISIKPRLMSLIQKQKQSKNKLIAQCAEN